MFLISSPAKCVRKSDDTNTHQTESECSFEPVHVGLLRQLGPNNDEGDCCHKLRAQHCHMNGIKNDVREDYREYR